MKKIYTSDNRIELQVLKAKLEENNIQTLIKNEQPPAAGEVPPVIAPPELWIMQDDQYAAAIEVLKDSINDATMTAWQCPNCGESDQITNICWKCSTPRGS